VATRIDVRNGRNSPCAMDRRAETPLQRQCGGWRIGPIVYVGVGDALAAATVCLRQLPTFDRDSYARADVTTRFADPLTIRRIARTEFDSQPMPWRCDRVASEQYLADSRGAAIIQTAQTEVGFGD
jgi:hypothetical protein